MVARELFEEALRKGIDLSVKNGKLIFKAKPHCLTEKLRNKLKQHKSELIEFILQEQESNRGGQLLEIKKQSSGKRLVPLSFAQQRLWFMEQLNGPNSSFNVPVVLKFTGKVDVKCLEVSLVDLIERHKVLKTRFHEMDGQVYQMTSAEKATVLTENVSSLSQFESICDYERNYVFEMSAESLCRFRLINVSQNNCYYLIATFHHSISDDWSISVLLNDLATIYHNYSERGLNDLVPLPIQYADYAIWQREKYTDTQLAKQLDYWVEELSGLPELSTFPTDMHRPIEQTFRGSEYNFSLPKKISDVFFRLLKDLNVTPFIGLLSAYFILLNKYSGQNDVAIGSPISNRVTKETEELMGFFVNNLVLRIDFSNEPCFKDVVEQLSKKLLGAFDNMDVPFEQIVEKINPQRSLSYPPLFQVSFLMNNEGKKLNNFSDIEVELIRFNCKEGEGVARYDLSFSLFEDKDNIDVNIQYNADLYHKATIERLAAHYLTVIDQVCSEPSRSISRLRILTEIEKGLLIKDRVLNTTSLSNEDFPHLMFEKQANLSPDRVAVTFNADDSLPFQVTYQKLNILANKKAQQLIDSGVVPGDVVGVCVERSIEMIVAMLASLKVGAGYLPINSNLPKARIKYMLLDSQAKYIVANSKTILGNYLKTHLNWITLINPYESKALNNVTTENLGIVSHSLDVSYLIYTSGSTGNPKGVVLTQQGLANLIIAQRMMFDINETSRIIQFASISFDAATWEIFMALANGASLHLYEPEGEHVNNVLDQFIERNLINIATLPPALLSTLNTDSFTKVRRLIVAGESINHHEMKRWVNNRSLVNAYGPTETTVCATTSQIKEQVNIGKPIQNFECFVLDDWGNQLPIGMVGELCVGGIGLARGYLNRAGLTAEKFVPNPFSERAGERLYRTGDLVRYLSTGDLEFIGRVDHQVKVRGFRIELGEIETSLLASPELKDVVVMAREDNRGSRRLVAYVVADERLDISESDLTACLRDRLSERLPEYMVPSAFVHLSALPLTVNGKVDRKALPAPEAGGMQPSYVAPSNGLERSLCEIWQSVLGHDSVGVTDNFFAIGGDSIVSIQVVSRAKKVGLRLSVRQLFKYPTIAELSRHIEHLDTVIEQSASEGRMALLPIHRWFFESDVPHPNHFHQSQLLQVPGDFSEAFLRAFVSALYARHDGLRLVYPGEGNTRQAEFVSVSDDRLAASVQTYRLSGEDKAARQAELKRYGESLKAGFDLATGPLMKAVYFDAPLADERCLLLVLHHLVVDGVSWRIILPDLALAYQQWQSGEAIALGAKTSSYQAWGEALQAYSERESLQAEKAYWVEQLSKPVEALPQANKSSANHNDTYGNERTQIFSLSKQATQSLLTHSGQAYRTQIQELLLAGLLMAFNRWTGQRRLRLNLEGHGRETEDFAGLDLSETVGWFTSLYPVCLEIESGVQSSQSLCLGEVIKQVKEQLRAVPCKGLGYGVLRYLANDETLIELANQQPVPVVFNYLGQFDQQSTDEQLFSPYGEQLVELAGKDVDIDHPRMHQLSINSLVTDDQFQFMLGYSPTQHDDATMQSLGEYFMTALEALVSHCTSDGAGSYTPSDFPLAKVSQAQLDDWQVSYPALTDLYPATGMQMGLVFHSLLDEANEAYATQLFLDIEGQFNLECFKSSWEKMCSRHAIFRTAYVAIDTVQPLQLVQNKVDLDWTEFDWCKLNETEQHNNFELFRKNDKAKGFDFAKAPLMRMSVFKLSENRYRWMWTHHHSLLDGWSMPIVFEELFQFYLSDLKQQPIGPLPSSHYKDYVHWGLSQNKSSAIEFWTKELENFESPTEMGIDKLHVNQDNKVGRQKILKTISYGQSQKLVDYAKSCGVTLNTVFQAAWAFLLYRYSSDNHVVFGQTVSGRPGEVAGIESIVGLLINTLPVSTKIDLDQSISDWLVELNNTQVEREKYSYLPLVDIQSVVKENSSNSLFKSLLVFENYPVGELLDDNNDSTNQELGFSIVNIDSDEGTDYEIALTVMAGEKLGLRLDYLAEKFAVETVERLLEHIVKILSSIVENSVELVRDIVYLTKQEEVQQIHRWNANSKKLDESLCVHQRFEKVVSERPDSIALAYVGTELYPSYFSYQKLNQNSNKLANYLIDKGVEQESPVGICVERSLEMIVSILAVLKSGGFYVPMDPTYPPERLEYILEHSRCKTVLTETHLLTDLSFLSTVKSVPVDSGLQDFLLEKYSATNLDSVTEKMSPDNLAYVIYTSGSTGKPKGTALSHKSLHNLAHFQCQQYGLSSNSRMLQFASFSFDAATWDWSMALTSGATLQLVQDDIVKSSDLLCQIVKQFYISYSFIPPALLNTLDTAAFSSLSTLTVGGEKPSLDVLRKWAKGRTVFNAYGPTENTVVATTDHVTPDVRTLSIGKPIENVRCFVLTPDNKFAPVGIIGELFIGGIGLARGYINNPGLTAKSFLPNPFSDYPGERIYKTGDLVRWLPSGKLEFVGRVDNQVKVRGYRIELGEIEALLASCQKVSESIVTSHVDYNHVKRLVAYIIPAHKNCDEDTAAILVNELRTFVQKKLPEYMVPSAFIVIEKIPLTINGKVDTKALPIPDLNTLQTSYVAPESETQKRLCEVWKSVLGVTQVGITDNFFSIGGDSILSIQIVSKAKSEGLLLTVGQLFRNPTIKALANEVSFVQEEMPQGMSQGEMIQLPIHQWFWRNNAPRPQHYHQSQLLQVPEDFSEAFLRAFVSALYARHDGLRLVYPGEGNTRQAEFVSVSDDRLAASVQTHRLSGEDKAARQAELKRYGESLKAGFDLATGPLMKAVYFDAPLADERCLLLVLHHLVVDGVSWRIILPDLALAYQQWQSGEAIALGAKTSSYQAWGEALQAYSESESLQAEKAYWVEQLSKPVEALPQANKSSANDNDTYGNERTQIFSLSKQATKSLLSNCSQAYRTQIQELLLAGLLMAFNRWTGQRRLRLSLEGHGRETEDFAGLDLSETVGWFTSLYPVCLEIESGVQSSQSLCLGEVIKQVKEQLRAVPCKGLGYGVLRYLANDETLIELANQQPVPVVFNYLGQFDQQLTDEQLFSPYGEQLVELAGKDVDIDHPRMHQLSINSLVTDDQFQFMLGYSPTQHDDATMQSLGEYFMTALEALVSHCTSDGAGSYTPSDFPLAKVSQAQLDDWQVSYPALTDLYPATGMQMGLVFHSLLDEANEAYASQTYLDFVGDFRADIFQQAWAKLVERHAIFRTAFIGSDQEQPLQLVVNQASLSWAEEDWRDLSEAGRESAFESYRQADKAKGFDFTQAPLMRMSLLRLSDNQYRWLWTHHHSLLDGWSMPIVLGDLFQLYEGLLKNQSVSLSSVVGYRDYVSWLVEQDTAKAKAYWRENLAGLASATQLGIASTELSDSATGYGEQSLTLSAERTAELSALAKQYGVTLNTVIQGAWSYLLYRYSGDSEVVFGQTVSGRSMNVSGIEQMVGLLINSLPVRVSIARDSDIGEWLQTLHHAQVERESNGFIPLVEIQRESELAAGESLFNSLLVFENYPVGDNLITNSTDDESDLGFSIGKVGSFEGTDYDLTLIVGVEKSLTLILDYARSKYDQSKINRLLKTFKIIIDGLLNIEFTKVNDLPYISERETNQLINEWNDTALDYPTEKCVHHLFEEQVALDSSKIAAIYEDPNTAPESLSYGELNQRANQLAHYLIAQGVMPETPVGLCVNRSLEMLVGLLGIQKAGGCYVPLDPAYPEERLSYLIEDSGVELIVTQSCVKASLSLDGFPGEESLLQSKRSILLDEADSPLNDFPQHNPVVAVAAGNLAYVIYTSGSTGQPKGVGIRHQGLVSLLTWSSSQLSAAERAGILASTSMCFDLSAYEFFLPLCFGTQCIVTDNILSYPHLSSRGEISLINTVPSAAKALLDEGALSSLSVINLAGEPLKASLVDRLYEVPGINKVYDLYGPSEDTTYSTFTLREANGIETIGRPVGNTQAYVLGSEGEVVSRGVVGELYLGGAGLARGYLNRAGLTAEKFVPNPFSERAGERLYRTGDLVRYLSTGDLEFIGRVDHQVKVRGFRIELGEIETSLLTSPELKDVVVMAREDNRGSRRLVAYVVADEHLDISESDLTACLRDRLSERLPEYMVPSAFVHLSALPLTVNGKVDRKALPAPEAGGMQPSYVAPSNGLERSLCEIWQSVLGHDSVGVTDNFFAIGGDSIVSIQVVSRAKKVGLRLSVRQLFKYPTIAELSRHIEHLDTVIEQSASEGRMALLPIHRWFFESDVPHPNHFHQSQLLQVPGDFSEAFLRAFVSALYARHDGLRLVYPGEGNTRQAEFVSVSDDRLAASVQTYRLSGEDKAARQAELKRYGESLKAGFDLATAPLMKAVYFDAPLADERCLLLVLHHLVVDGVSWRVLLQDLALAYQQWQSGEAIALGAKTSSYQAWGEALQAYSERESLQAEKAYWVEQLSKPVEALPQDKELAAGEKDTYGEAAQQVVSLSEAATQSLLTHSGQAYRTQIQELLLAGLLMAFNRWTGQRRLRLNLEGHGRETEDFAGLDLSETVGWFTSLYPVCLEIESGVQSSQSLCLGEVIKQVKEQLRAVPCKGLGYGVLRYLANDETLIELANQQPVPVVFNYLGQFDSSVPSQKSFKPISGLLENNSGSNIDKSHPRSHQLGFNGGVNNGRLQFSLDYNPRCYDEATMQSLGEYFMTALEALVSHCTSDGAGSYTPSDFPLAKVSQAQLDDWQVSYPALTDLYPATGMQMGLVFHSLLDEANEAYATQTYLDFVGDFRADIFQQAWAKLVERHAIFRTAFIGSDQEQPLQLVVNQASLSWAEEDWRDLSEAERESAFESYRQADKAKGFDFTQAPLMRMSLLRLSDNQYRWLWTHHHSLLDGWSMPIVLGDLFQLYEGLLKNQSVSLSSVVGYRDYVSWLVEQDTAKAKAYWRENLAGLASATQLGIASTELSDSATGYGEQLLTLSAERTAELSALAKQYGVTLNTVIQGAWSYLLYRYSGDSEVVFGQTVSGRSMNVSGIEQMVGLLINSLPVRVSIARDSEIGEWLQTLHHAQVERESNGFIPLVEIQQESQLAAGEHLFNTLLVFENYPVSEKLKETSDTKTKLGFEMDAFGSDESSEYELMLTVVPSSDLNLKLTYSKSYYCANVASSLLSHLNNVLEGFTNQSIRQVKSLPYLDEAEQLEQVVEWNNTRESYPENLCVHELFESQAKKNPDAIALIYEGRYLSYGELERRSNQLAHYLTNIGVTADNRVGMCIKRSCEAIVGLLGILKAGACYVPIDSELPKERANVLIKEAKIERLVTLENHSNDYNFSHDKTISLNEVFTSAVSLKVFNALDNKAELNSNGACYLIFTSGSTGQPKGVMGLHKSLVNRIDWYQKTFNDLDSDVHCQKTNFSFVDHIAEIFQALTLSRPLVIFSDQDMLSTISIKKVINQNEVSQITLVPSLLNLVLSEPEFVVPSIRRIFSSGESASLINFELFHQTFSGVDLFNVYGSSEVGADATCYKMHNESSRTWDYSFIGRPIQNCQTYILSENSELMPKLSIGELCIGGDCLARGYFDQASVTANKFIPNLFSDKGERLYRTGDLARLNLENQLEFMGRIDHQVKVRGARIEPHEIENTLKLHGRILNSAVTTINEEDDVSLVAFVVKKSNEVNVALDDDILIRELDELCRSQLPTYMVPSFIKIVEDLPLTHNGKLDRNTLKTLPIGYIKSPYEEPVGDVECLLAELYCEVLKTTEVGRHDNFFKLGGHSLNAIRVLSNIQSTYGCEISFKSFFENPTIFHLAELIEYFTSTLNDSSEDVSEFDVLEI